MELRHTALADLVSACREQTARYLRREPSQDVYCYEILRRALAERDDDAWQAVVGQYGASVLAWVRHHPVSAAVREDDYFWVNRTFERLWSAVGSDRFGSFESLPAILRYLKLCAHSVLQDAARAQAATRFAPLDDDAADLLHAPDLETTSLGTLAAGELWNEIEHELHNDAERTVAHLSFVLDYQPREIHERNRAVFASVADVYRIKRNLLDRLRRSAAIRSYLHERSGT